MPEPEGFGAVPVIELLRSYLDEGGMYDLKKLFWKRVEDCCLVVAGSPPCGGRYPLTPRFTRHFNVLSIPEPEEKILKNIFTKILKSFLNADKFS